MASMEPARDNRWGWIPQKSGEKENPQRVLSRAILDRQTSRYKLWTVNGRGYKKKATTQNEHTREEESPEQYTFASSSNNQTYPKIIIKMVFNFGTALVLATAVSAIPHPRIAKRDVDTVLANLENIDTETNALTATITDWDGSLLGALGISSDTTTLEVRQTPFYITPANNHHII